MDLFGRRGKYMFPFILAAVVGGALVNKMTDYPSEIKNLRRQIPKEDRDAFMREYKNLSKENKTQFKQYLREANLTEASKVIGRDLSGYTVNAKGKARKIADASAPPAALTGSNVDNGLNERIKNILSSYQLESDPQLVSEAAKRYEKIAGYHEMNILDRTRKILDVAQ